MKPDASARKLIHWDPLQSTWPLAISIAFLFWQVRFCFSSSPFQSVDLHSHIELTEKVLAQLQQGRLIFYDTSNFTGWVVGLFYPTLSHILAALFSLPLSLFSSDPVRLAVQSILGLSLVSLPFSISMTIRSLRNTEKLDLMDSSLAAVFAIFFLALPLGNFGIGLGTGISSGLYPQVLAWHFLLLLIACSARKTGHRHLPLAVFALWMTHPLTGLFGLLTSAPVYWARFGTKRLLFNFGLGIGLLLWWLVPFQMNSSAWLPQHPIPIQDKSIFVLLFREIRAQEILLKISNWAITLLVAFGIFSLLFTKESGFRYYKKLFFLAVLLPPFIESNLLLQIFPGSIHLYRLWGPIFLFLFCIGAVGIGNSFEKFALPTRPFILVFLLLFVGQCALFPPTIAQNSKKLFSLEKRFAHDILQRYLPERSRLYFEYLGFSEADRHPSPHYFFSEASRNQEVLNGLFLQSSLASRFFHYSISNLGIRPYSLPDIFGPNENTTDLDFLEQLRLFGLTHIVFGNDNPILWKSTTIYLRDSKSFGAYRLVAIPPRAPESIGKLLLGYRDQEGSLPFQVLEYLFYTNPELWKNFDLVEIPPLGKTPPGLAAELIQTSDLNSPSASASTQSERFEFFFHPAPRKYQNLLQPDGTPEATLLVQAKIELLNNYHLDSKLLEFRKRAPSTPSPIADGGDIVWNFSLQTLRAAFHENKPWKRLPYSASPGWRADQGPVYRGFPERLLVQTSDSEVNLHFSFWFIPGAKLGAALSSVALLIWLIWRAE